MDSANGKSGTNSPASPFQFFPTTPVRPMPSLSPASSPGSSHVTAVSYKDYPSSPIGLSLSPPCATSAQSDDDYVSPSAESSKASADMSSHPELPKAIEAQPAPVPHPAAAEKVSKATLSVVTPYPPFPAPTAAAATAASSFPFAHLPPYRAASAAGWWAPFVAFPSHALPTLSPAAGQAQQQAPGTQPKPFVANVAPWFYFGPPPFLPRPYPAVLPSAAAVDMHLEPKTGLAVAASTQSGAASSVSTKASAKRNPSAKLMAKPVEVSPRERLPSGFRPWKAAGGSCGSNDTSALLSSNGATSAGSAAAAAAAAVEACASSRQVVPFTLKPCSQSTEGLQQMKADGQPIQPAAQQLRGQAGSVNAVNTVNAVSAMSQLPIPLHILPAISPIPSIPSAAADQARAYACSMGQYPNYPWSAAAAAAAAAAAGAGGLGFMRPGERVSAEAEAGVVGEKRRLGRAEAAAAGCGDAQGKRKKRQKHSVEVLPAGGRSDGVGCGVVEGLGSSKKDDESGGMERECDNNLKKQEDREKEREKEKSCRNCGTHTTPFWRKDRSGSGQHLCNACGLYLAKNDAPRPSVLWKKESHGPTDSSCSGQTSVAPKA
ncbi:hypothetical protein CLOM_g1109 [Closterium sp. NIES-68]|nr:hypothetical protein CLOM_g1109 [Closterium sp. NIES-68]GJP62108.1 hypothetical protein CLOP_g19203 [Closterium sp. NIES-67]GJP73664.1 hypothetical protein CLOP_g4359 [Closterium sp. NIES-67]